MSDIWHQILNSLQHLWDWLQIIATSWLAYRIYVAAAAILLIGLSIRFATKKRNQVVEMQPFRGRKPRKPEAIEKQLALARAHRLKMLQILAWRTLLVFLCGFLVPAMVLASFLYFYAWFFPAGQALKPISGTPAVITAKDVAIYVLSQVTMGTSHVVNDILTSRPLLKLSIVPLQPANETISWVAIGFRYFIGVSAGVLADLLQAMTRAVLSKGTVEKELEERLRQSRQGVPVAQTN